MANISVKVDYKEECFKGILDQGTTGKTDIIMYIHINQLRKKAYKRVSVNQRDEVDEPNAKSSKKRSFKNR